MGRLSLSFTAALGGDASGSHGGRAANSNLEAVQVQAELPVRQTAASASGDSEPPQAEARGPGFVGATTGRVYASAAEFVASEAGKRSRWCGTTGSSPKRLLEVEEEVTNALATASEAGSLRGAARGRRPGRCQHFELAVPSSPSTRWGNQGPVCRWCGHSVSLCVDYGAFKLLGWPPHRLARAIDATPCQKSHQSGRTFGCVPM